MNDDRELLERVGDRVPMPEPAFERIVRRRQRKQRNKRITATGLGVSITVALVLALMSATPRAAREPLQTPSPTPIDGAAPLDLLPPAGSELTTGGVGQLMFWFREGTEAGTTLWLYLYADGRLITNPGPYDETLDARWVERRLTPDGVQLMLDAVAAADLPAPGRRIVAQGSGGWHQYSAVPGFDDVVSWGARSWITDPNMVANEAASAALIHLSEQLDDPGSWFPPSAWDRAEPVRFAPSTYLVTVEALNEKPASDEWLSRQTGLDDLPIPTGVELPAIRGCEPVDLEAARGLASALDNAEMRFSWDAYIGLDSDPGTGMVWPGLSGARPVVIRIAIPLPHEGCDVKPDR